MPLVDHALAHLGGEEGNAGLLDELFEHPAGHLAVRARADDEHRRPGVLDHLHRLAHRLWLSRRAPCGGAHDRTAVGLLLGDILGKLEVDRAGLFLFGEAIGLAHAARDIVARCELVSILRDRLHHRHHVEDLEPALLRFLDRLLPGDHQHRHPAERRIGRRGDEVRRAGPQRGDADAGLAGVPAIRRRHEARALFVAGQDQPDLVGSAEAVEEIEVLFAGHAEDVFAPFSLEALDEEVRSLLLSAVRHSAIPPGPEGRA